MHLRLDQPECRTDNYTHTMIGKLNWLYDLQQEHGNCPVVYPGDLFDKWKSSPELEALAILKLPKGYAVPGNHDLPYHNTDLFDRASLAVLTAAGTVECLHKEGSLAEKLDSFITGFPEGSSLKGAHMERDKNDRLQIALMHEMVWSKDRPYPGCEADNAKRLMKKMKNFDLIVTGDNHAQFVVENNDQILVNAGSFMRMSADQKDFKPAVYLYYADDHEVERIPIPIEKNVISRDHLDKVNKKQGRMNAFVKALNDQIEVGMSFEKNVEMYLKKNKIEKHIRTLVEETIDG